MVELLALMAAITPCTFFRHFWYALDFFIIAVSLSLEAAFKVIDDDQLATYFGAIVLFRCWRFVRISHGLIEVTTEMTAQKYEKIVKVAEELEELMAEHKKKIAASGRDETDSVREIQILSKELADKLLATTDESNDEVRLSKLKEAVGNALHKSLHKRSKDDSEGSGDKSNVDVNGTPDLENGVVSPSKSEHSEEA